MYSGFMPRRTQDSERVMGCISLLLRFLYVCRRFGMAKPSVWLFLLRLLMTTHLVCFCVLSFSYIKTESLLMLFQRSLIRRFLCQNIGLSMFFSVLLWQNIHLYLFLEFRRSGALPSARPGLGTERVEPAFLEPQSPHLPPAL